MTKRPRGRPINPDTVPDYVISTRVTAEVRDWIIAESAKAGMAKSAWIAQRLTKTYEKIKSRNGQ